MGTWRTVDVWPCSGFPDRPWQEHPDDDAFVRSAQRVWRTYARALPALELPLKAGHLRVFMDSDPTRRIADPAAPATVTITRLENEWRNNAIVRLPPGVSQLSPCARGLLALDVLHASAIRLAELAGWDPERVVPAREYVLEQNLEFTWHSPWKSSPDRKHKARAAYRIDDDGLGRMRFEVTDGSRTMSTPWGLTAPNYGYAAKTLRWDGSGALTFASFDHRVGRADLADLADLAPPPPPGITVDSVRPLVTHWAPPPPPANFVNFVGGGDTGALTRRFTGTLWRLFEQMESPSWQAWWAPSQLGVLQLMLELGPGTPPPVFYVRKTTGKVDARLRVASVPAGVDPAAHAHALTLELLDKIRQRSGLGMHPDLRG